MFDLDEIQQRTSAETYSRGLNLFHNNKVTNLKKCAETVTADVLGQYKYKVELKNGEFIQNSCTCPAAEYQDFCKHCVAVAMAASDEESEVTAEQAITEDKLKSWLLSQSSEYLVDALMGYITRDADEYDLWHQRCAFASTKVDTRDIGKMITAALPLKDLWEYRKVLKYFEQAEAKLLPLIDIIDELETEQRFKLLDKLLARFNKALLRVDDSAGYRFTLEDKIISSFVSAFRALKWKLGKKIKYLVEKTCDSLDIFPDLPDGFALTSEEHRLYVAGCHEKLASLEGEGLDEESGLYWSKHRLANVVIEDARERDDFDTELQVKILCAGDSCYDCLDISELYIKQGDLLEAEHWLQKARKAADGPHYSRRCDHILIELYLAQGKQEAAWQVQWSHFKQDPGYLQFKSLVELSARCGKSPDDYYAEAEQGLLDYAEEVIGSSPYYFTNPYDEVVRFYLFTEQNDKALAYSMERRIDARVLLVLADKVMPDNPADAVNLYHRVMVSIAQLGNNEAYEEVGELAEHLQNQLKQYAGDISFRQQLDKLLAVSEIRRKRNLMKLLAEKFDLR